MNSAQKIRRWRHCLRAFALVLLFVVAILPRSAGAFVFHSHTGHGLHVHLVPGMENGTRGFDRAAFHARHHAHSHGDEHSDDSSNQERDVLLGVVPEPAVRSVISVTQSIGVDRTTAFLGEAVVPVTRSYGALCDRARPPLAFGRSMRSGTRALIRTSSALRL